MSYIYKALQQAELENAGVSALQDREQATPDLVQLVGEENYWLEQVPTVKPVIRAENRMVTLSDDESLGDEKFRLLRARLLHLQDRAELKKIVITSAVPGEGKTTVASNLAISLARHTAQRVLLLEGDLRQPQLANKFGLPDLRGVSEWFEGEESLSHFIYRLDSLQLWLLPGGNPADDALKILQSKRFAEGLNRLTGCFNWIIVDAPPLMPLADVHLWAEQADGILLVIRNGKTPKRTLLKGLEGLSSAKLLGTVLNDVLPTSGDDYAKYYRAHNRKNGNGKAQSDPTQTQ
jgi:capsular exopolysaccharide synthesis family protein